MENRLTRKTVACDLVRSIAVELKATSYASHPADSLERMREKGVRSLKLVQFNLMEQVCALIYRGFVQEDDFTELL
jgi:hypothetical protein